MQIKIEEKFKSPQKKHTDKLTKLDSGSVGYLG